MIFAPNRSQMVTLSPTPTLNPGDPAIKYPWAIYCDVAQSFFMDHVVVGGAWNGVYIRGQTFILGQCFVGCMNVGLDVDECYNFPKVDHFMLWGWGISTGMSGIYYDGQTVAANIGRCDDFTCDVFQTWCGIVNITAAFSWGQINQLKLDGDNSRLNVAAVAGTWLQIGKFYKTGGANASPAVPVNLSGASTVSIDNALITTAQNSPTITLAGGSLTINSGSMWNGVQGANPMISVTGGDLSMDKMRFDSSDNRGQGYLVQTGGSVRVNNSAFVKSPLPGTAAFVLTDNPRNAITNVDFNGWTFYAPGPLGRYESRGGLGVTRTNGGNVFQDPDTPTTAQVTLIPLPANAKEGKLRFFGSFPTSADTAPRMAASLRGGFNSLSWTDTYLKVFVTNSQNDATSDANTAEVASFTPLGAYAGSNTLGVTVLGINGANGAPRLLRYETAGSARFDIIMETAESGGNSGADISFRTYDDNGNSLGNPITLKRSNATVGISNLAVGTVNGPTIRAGTGAATGTQPKGSIWMRTDGAAGSTLYVTQGGGTWAAVAGV
jgi:hypothetical protein